MEEVRPAGASGQELTQPLRRFEGSVFSLVSGTLL